jgi:DNA-binding transcriptional LysR family regulator
VILFSESLNKGAKILNTKILKYAVEIERVGSISKTAEKFYMNQATMSKIIRDFEETLGIVIFKRTPTGMVPTKKGTEFLMHAKSVLKQVIMMENLVSSDSVQKITFNITVPRASYIAYAFTEFIKKLPAGKALAVDYRETNSINAIRDVTDGENDLGVIRFPAEYENYFVGFLGEKDLDFEPISRFEYLALFSKDHPLAGKTLVDPLELEECIEIVHGDTNVPSFFKKKNYFDGVKKEIAVYERASQLELLKHIPTTYMWVSPMPEEILSTFNLVECRCDSPQKNYQRDLVIYRKDHHFTDEEISFISQLKQIVKETVFFQHE